MSRQSIAFPAMSKIRLFISHASDDVELANRIVALFRAALNLPAAAIRCTSVDGHRVSGGADFDAQLRRELRESEALVGILSANSMRSAYVLIELGARWVLKKHLLPLLAPGTPASVLGGPLAGLNALNAGNPAELHQMIVEVAGVLQISPESPAVYQGQIDAVTDTTQSGRVVHTSSERLSPIASVRQLLDDAVARQLGNTHAELPLGILDIHWKPGTTSLDVEVTKRVRDLQFDNLRVQVIELYQWSEADQYFRDGDVNGSPFVELHSRPVEVHPDGYAFGSGDHFDGLSITYLFLGLEHDHLQYGGTVGSSLRICTVRSPGLWRVGIRTIVTGVMRYGRTIGTAWELSSITHLFFSWDGAGVPTPSEPKPAP